MPRLSDGNRPIQVNVLNQVQKSYTVFHGPLERFTAGDKSRAAGALVDHRGENSFGEIVGAGGATGVNKAGTAHIAVQDLVTGEIDGVFGGELAVYEVMRFAKVLEGIVATVVRR
jgi:hypothetical protein